jgi:hypothetical protein
LQVAVGPQCSDLNGSTEPASSNLIELQVDSEDIHLVEEVRDGTFTFHGVPHGLIRLHILKPDAGGLICTDWFRV